MTIGELTQAQSLPNGAYFVVYSGSASYKIAFDDLKRAINAREE